MTHCLLIRMYMGCSWR